MTFRWTIKFAFGLMSCFGSGRLMADENQANLRLVGIIDRQVKGENQSSLAVLQDRRTQKTHVLKSGQSLPFEPYLVVDQVSKEGVWIRHGERKWLLSFEGRSLHAPETMEPLVDASIDTDQIKARTDELLQAFESEWEEAPSQELDQDSMQENGVQGQFPVPPIKRRDSFGSEEQDESEQEYIACIANEEWCDDETIERRNWLEKVNLLMKSPETLETKGLVTE